MAAWELWNYRQWVYLALNESGSPAPTIGRAFCRTAWTLLTKRVGDMELLVLILLGTSGLYAIVFVASSYFSATSFARQADQTIRHIQDQIGLAMGDLRELQEETEQRLHQMTTALTPETPPEQPVPDPQMAGWETQVAEMTARLSSWQNWFRATCR